MEPIYIAAIISFVIGVFGYIIVRFWVLPIGRYIRVKSRLTSELRALLNMLPTEQSGYTENTKINDRQVALRRHS